MLLTNKDKQTPQSSFLRSTMRIVNDNRDVQAGRDAGEQPSEAVAAGGSHSAGDNSFISVSSLTISLSSP